MGMVGTGSCYRQPECLQVREDGLSLDGCWSARGRPSIPWPGSTPGQRQSSRPSAVLWPGRPRRGPSVDHGYKNVKGQGIVTTPCRPPLPHAVRAGETGHIRAGWSHSSYLPPSLASHSDLWPAASSPLVFPAKPKAPTRLPGTHRQGHPARLQVVQRCQRGSPGGSWDPRPTCEPSCVGVSIWSLSTQTAPSPTAICAAGRASSGRKADGRHRQPGPGRPPAGGLHQAMGWTVRFSASGRGRGWSHRLGSSSARNQLLGSGSAGPRRAGSSSGLEAAARSGTSCWLTGSASTRTSCRCPVSVSVTTSVTR
jgi:hypothetical protein